MHRVISREVIKIHPQIATEESVVVRCFETKKDFSTRMIFFYNNKNNHYDNPQIDYTYCPYCGANIDEVHEE